MCNGVGDTLEVDTQDDRNMTIMRNGNNAETSDMCTMNNNTTIAAKRCSLGAWFVSGI